MATPGEKLSLGGNETRSQSLRFPNAVRKKLFFRFCRGIRNNIFSEERERGQ